MIRSTIRAIFEKNLMFHELEVNNITDGVTVLDASRNSLIYCNTGVSSPENQTCGLSAPETENNTPGTVRPQLLYIMCGETTAIELDQTVVGSAFMYGMGSALQIDVYGMAQLMYSPTGGGAWLLVGGNRITIVP